VGEYIPAGVKSYITTNPVTCDYLSFLISFGN